MKFLNSPTTKLFPRLKNILFAFVGLAIYIFAITHFLDWLNPPPPADPFSGMDSDGPPVKYIIFMTCIWAPLWEELAFRHAPGLIAKHFGNQYLFPVMIISSIIFGWGHGYGPESLLRQGVMGFIFFFVYVKNNYSYWSSVLLHMMWNTLIFIILPK